MTALLSPSWTTFSPPSNFVNGLCTIWMKHIHEDLSLLDLGIHEARDLVQNQLSGDWCLCTVLYTRSGACYYWIGKCRRLGSWFMSCTKTAELNEMSFRISLVWTRRTV